MAKLKILTERDKKILQASIDKVRRLSNNAAGRGRATEDDTPAPEVYVARTPAAGISRIDGLTPGSAECDIWRIIPDQDPSIAPTLQQVSSFNKTVYNLGPTDIQGNRWVTVLRDKFGYWFPVAFVEEDITDTTTGTGTVGIEDIVCGATITRTVVDRVSPAGCQIMVRERQLSFPCGDIVATSIKYIPICTPETVKVPQNFEIIDGQIYVEYWDVEWPSARVKRKYCEISQPTNCASGSGSFLGCIAGCYTVFINAHDDICGDCYANVSQVIELVDNGDCTLLGEVITCLDDRVITVEDNGTQLTITITDQSTGALIARWAIDDGAFDPYGITALYKEYGDDSCIWPNIAFLEPCYTGTGSNPAAPGLSESCACSGGFTGTGTGSDEVGDWEDTARYWRMTFGQVDSFSCNCSVFGCTFCLECSHDEPPTPGAIFGGEDGLQANERDLIPPCSRCLWSDYTKTRSGGSAYDGCEQHGVPHPDYLVVLRGNSDFWELTVEAKGDSTDVVARYSARPPTSCNQPYVMRLQWSNEVDCLPWPPEITLYPSNTSCSEEQGCASTCPTIAAYSLSNGFLPGINGTMSETKYYNNPPDDEFTLCPAPTYSCLEVYTGPFCLIGGPCEWSTTISLPANVIEDCTLPDVELIITDEGDFWYLKVLRTYPSGYLDNGDGTVRAIELGQVVQALYEAPKPNNCADDIIFELIAVNDDKCTDWPCSVTAVPVVLTPDCEGCPPADDCTEVNGPTTWNVTTWGATDGTCADCEGLVTVPQSLTRNSVCKWSNAVSFDCSGMWGLTLEYNVGSGNWELRLDETGVVKVTWTLPKASFDCAGTNIMVNPVSTDGTCVWPATVTVVAVP